MTSPYTAQPFDAFMVAQGSVALALTAVLLFRRARPMASRLLFLAAIFVAVVAPSVPDPLRALGYPMTPDGYLRWLAASSLLAGLALLASSPKGLVVAALVGGYGLHKVDHYLLDHTLELSALHVTWIGVLLGLEKLTEPPPADPVRLPEPRRFLAGDLSLAAVAFALAMAVAIFVLKRRCDSADEWAYTFQSAVFAKLHAYSVAPDCYDAFQNFWVFQKDGHVFSQYLPGWALVMAPFTAVGIPWVAGPFGLAVLVLGIARLGRRAAAASVEADAPGAERQARLGGTIAAVALMMATTVLINGASRFPHVWVCAMYTWSIEAICVLTSPLDPRRQARWGVVLGVSLAWLLATRHVDGLLLGPPMFVYCLYALARRRFPLRGAVAATVALALWGGVSLVLLRLQLGHWFATGYSLTEVVHPWNKFALSMPKPNEWKWGIPMATGAYCWWPLAPAIGLAGMIALARTRERRLPFLLCLGTLFNLAFYTALEYGRGWDFGYGPRYELVVIVPMAVGTGVLFAPLFEAALRRAGSTVGFFEAGPAALAVAAAVLGVIRLAPLLYPPNAEDVQARNVLAESIEREKLTNAVVWIQKGLTISDWLDLTQNLPPDLYADPVLVLLDRSPEVRKCVHDSMPTRRFYRAQGRGEIHFVPE